MFPQYRVTQPGEGGARRRGATETWVGSGSPAFRRVTLPGLGYCRAALQVLGAVSRAKTAPWRRDKRARLLAGSAVSELRHDRVHSERRQHPTFQDRVRIVVRVDVGCRREHVEIV